MTGFWGIFIKNWKLFIVFDLIPFLRLYPKETIREGDKEQYQAFKHQHHF